MELTVLILSYNEEVNINQSITNVIGWAKEVIVLDSFSSDNTVEIAQNLGAKIFMRKFDNYAAQRNHAIKELPIKTEWVLFLDADEYLTNELKNEIEIELINPKFDGYLINRKFYFLGKWIKYGGYYPSWNLRLFKRHLGSVNREINEHVEINGKVGSLKFDMVDDNKKGLNDWIIKHNKYATFEAEQLLIGKKNKDELAKFFGNIIERKRWIRQYIWNPLLPPLLRPFIYFFYRYLFRLGFLDGKTGFIFHFLHALWFYFLIDVKYMEMKLKQK